MECGFYQENKECTKECRYFETCTRNPHREVKKMATITQPIVIDGIEFVINSIRGITCSFPDKPEYEEGFRDCLNAMVDALENMQQSPAAGFELTYADTIRKMTNADIIRNMTDAELAEWLFNIESGDIIGFCQNKEWCFENMGKIPEENCKKCLLEWLKGSVSNGN